MNRTNKLRLTWISFFSYGFTGALVITTGVVLSNIAEYFHLPVSIMSNTFTFLNSGILTAIFINTWMIEIIPIKRQLMFGFLLMLLAILGLINSYTLIIFSLSIFALGIVSGITMSIGTYLITYLYYGRQRGSRLLFTDSFFSMAGILFPMLAGELLTYHITWYWIYACISTIYIIIFILTLISKFPIIDTKNHNKANITPISKERWGPGVILLAGAVLCYILGQLGFISWIPEYATLRFHINIQQSSRLISYFWIAYIIGMWVFSALLPFFDLQRIVTLLTAISTLIMYLFINAKNLTHLSYFLLALGFISSAIYTTLITLSSQQTRIISPKLVNFILTCGTIGAMMTFIVTGPIVTHFGVEAALLTSNILYATVFIFCLILGFVSRHRQYGELTLNLYNNSNLVN